jgi:hypothetical protein
MNSLQLENFEESTNLQIFLMKTEAGYWKNLEVLRQQSRDWPLPPHSQKLRHTALIWCQLCSLKREPSCEAQKDFPGLPLGILAPICRVLPINTKSLEYREFLPALCSWKDALSSEQCFPDVQTQYTGRSAREEQDRCLSLLTKRVCDCCPSRQELKNSLVFVLTQWRKKKAMKVKVFRTRSLVLSRRLL